MKPHGTYDIAFQAGAASRDAEIAELKVVSDHNLATYHQAAGVIRAERDQLREQLNTARNYLERLKSRGNGDCHGNYTDNSLVTEALAATEPKP